ncbi:uncharacterized protein N7515_007262 [Penicillium bovifimosum]|uniref:Chitin-binding type-4 domain-containing protein n=1 Tax=Penicillium bovifimosum TaxID=126998 RepID=A0A9W9L0I7_9EURO|nr:uncharacterized protein N7515_007262 [Penicillium bovifimosum]KAJ5131223.1 hypothetical protein N7515_007262 [Penicillium bovifimosum]
MKHFTSFLAIASIISLVHGHGFISSPNPRMPGNAMKATCGAQAYRNEQFDKYDNIQGLHQVAAGQPDYNAAECNLWLCKGYKFADNKENVYSYKAGEKVHFTIDILVPHTGVANVSVVHAASNAVIGKPLIFWANYASVATGVTDDETNFSITIPDDIGSQCAKAGDCVLQWYWDAPSIDQTYESCVDFTVKGTGPRSGSAKPSATSSKVVAVTSSVASVQSQTLNPTPTPIAVRPSTLATSARQSATAEPEFPTSAADEPDSDGTELDFPTDSAADVLDWLESLLGDLLDD